MRLKKKISFLILFLVLLLIVQFLFLSRFSIFDIYISDTFNLQLQVKDFGLDLLHLDKLHAEILLKRGLPIVRVAENDSISKTEDDRLMSFASRILFDLPPSFFSSPAQPIESMPSSTNLNFAESAQIQKKMRAEGHHQGEKVELDFWQTESKINPQEEKNNNSQTQFSDNPKRTEKSTGQKMIGIYHTHTAENYENRGYNAHAQAGNRGDVIEVGRWIKERLETEYNISVVHSQNVHDQTYDRSYIRSLKTAKRMVDNNKELDMIFDIHRDAIGVDNKEYLTTEINGQKVAKIMIVVTNNNYGLPHPQWQKNFSFAKRLAAKINQKYPGLLRKVKLISNRRYNQHVHPKALLLEVGGANSTLPEAKRASYLLAEVLAELMAAES